jgi:hypothetical protein
MNRPQFGRHAFQPIRIPRQKRHIIAVLCELLDGCAANASARASDDSDLGHFKHLCEAETEPWQARGGTRQPLVNSESYITIKPDASSWLRVNHRGVAAIRRR